LTPKGQAVLKDAYPIWQAAQTRAIAAMGTDSRERLDELLGNAVKLAAV
jgi:hypothetical protein